MDNHGILSAVEKLTSQNPDDINEANTYFEERIQNDPVEFLFESNVIFKSSQGNNFQRTVNSRINVDNHIFVQMGPAIKSMLLNIENSRKSWKQHTDESRESLISDFYSYLQYKEEYIIANIPTFLTNFISFLLEVEEIELFTFKFNSDWRVKITGYSKLLEPTKSVLLFFSEALKNGIINEKDPMYKLSIMKLYGFFNTALSLDADSDFRLSALRCIQENLYTFDSILNHPKLGQESLNMLFTNIHNFIESATVYIDDDIYKFYRKFIKLNYNLIGNHIRYIYSNLKKHIIQGTKTYSYDNPAGAKLYNDIKKMKSALIFWSKVADIELELRNRKYSGDSSVKLQNFILGSQEEIMDLIFNLLKKNDPPQSDVYVIESDMPESIALELMMKMFALEPKLIYENVYTKISSYPSTTDAKYNYACTLLLSAFVHKSERADIKKFFIDKIIPLCENAHIKNMTMRYSTLLAISTIVGTYPNLFRENLDMIQTFINLYEQQVKSPNERIVSLALYILSIVLFSSPSEQIKASIDLRDLTESLFAINRKDSDVCKYVVECLVAIFGISNDDDRLLIWTEILQIKEHPMHVCSALILFGNFQPPLDILEQSVDFLVKEAENSLCEESFIALVKVLPKITNELSDRFIPQILTIIETAIESGDKNTIEAPELLLGFIAVNYSSHFASHAKIIIEKLVANLRNESLLVDSYISTIAVLCDICQESYNEIKNYELFLSNLILNLCETNPVEPLLDAAFSLLSFILQKSPEVGKQVYKRVFKVINAMFAGKIYADQIAQSIINILLNLLENYYNQTSFLMMNESISWLAKTAFNSNDKILSKAAEELLQRI